MSESNLHELFGAIEGDEPTSDFVSDLWSDLEAELALQDNPAGAVTVPAEPTQPVESAPRRRLLVGAVLAAAAVVLAVVGLLVFDGGSDRDNVIVTATPTTNVSTPEPSPSPDPTPEQDALPPPASGGSIVPELRHVVNEADGDPPVLASLDSGAAYELGRLPGTIVQVPDLTELPAGWAWTPRMDDGRNLQVELIREMFVPAPPPGADYPSDYPAVLDRYRTPTGRMPTETFAYPLVELVRFPPLGATVEEVTATIVETQAIEVLSAPQATRLGGAEGLAFEARTTGRALIASESSGGRNPVSYLYPQGVRLDIHVLDTRAGVVVVAVSAEEGSYEAWKEIAQPLVEGLFFNAE